MERRGTPQVDQGVVQALMEIDPEGEAIADKIVRESVQRRIISELRRVGKPARNLRRRLQERWEGSWGSDVPGEKFAKGTKDGAPEELQSQPNPDDTHHDSDATTANPEPHFQRWAFGIEVKGKWHIFKKAGKDWRHQGVLKGLASGNQEGLLEAIAKGGGNISKAEALQLFRKSKSDNDSRLFNTVKSELTRIRYLIREAMGLPRKARAKSMDPLPWERSSRGWRAEVSIGVAIQMDAGYADSQTRFRFKRSDELSRDERIDSQP